LLKNVEIYVREFDKSKLYAPPVSALLNLMIVSQFCLLLPKSALTI